MGRPPYVDETCVAVQGVLANIGLVWPMSLLEDAAVGATTIEVYSLNSNVIAEGGFVVIDLGTDECEIKRVEAISGNEITVSALSYAHDAEDVVLWTTNPLADVMWFGAIIDGVTDNATAINRALASGFHAYLPYTGYDYVVGSTLLIPSNGGLIGESPDVVIKLADAADCHLIENSDIVGGNTDILIRNLYLNNNRPNQTNGLPANTSHGIHMEIVDGLTVANVYITDVIDQGCKFKDVSNFHIYNVTVDGAGTECWSLDNCSFGDLQDVRALNFDGLDANGVDLRPGGASGWGFEIEDGSNNLNFNGVVVKDCVQAGGFHTQSHGVTYCSDINVANIQIIDSTIGIGLGITGLDGPMHVANLHVAGCLYAINVAGPDHFTVDGFYLNSSSEALRWASGTTGKTCVFSNGVIVADRGFRMINAVNAGRLFFNNVDMVCSGVVIEIINGVTIEEFVYTGGLIHTTGAVDAISLNDAGNDRLLKFVGLDVRSDGGKALFVNNNVELLEFVSCEFASGVLAWAVHCDGGNDDVTFFGGRIWSYSVTGKRGADFDGGRVSLVGVFFDDCSDGANYMLSSPPQSVIGCKFIGGSNAVTNTPRIFCYNQFSGQTGNIVLAAQIGATDIIEGNLGWQYKKFVALPDGDTTPSVDADSVCWHGLFTLAHTNPTTITDFDDGYEGQLIEIHFTDAQTTLDDAPNIMLDGSANYNPPTGTIMQFRQRGSVWYEVARRNT
jgi:hypothetical protein